MGIGSNIGGTFVEATPTKYKTVSKDFVRKILVYGEPSSDSISSEFLGIPKRVITKTDASKYGSGSHLESMLSNMLGYKSNVEIYACPLEVADINASVSTSNITVIGVPTKSGVEVFYINGIRVPVSIPASLTIEAIRDAIISAVASIKELPVIAMKNDTDITGVILKSKWKGLSANEITIKQNINDADLMGLPIGTTFDITDFSGGLGLPIIEDTFNNWGSTYFTMVCLPYLDDTLIDSLTDMANIKWSPKVNMAFQFVGGYNGDKTSYLEKLNKLNNKFFTLGWVEGSSTPSYLIASSFSMFIEDSHLVDPAIAYYGIINDIEAGVHNMQIEEKEQIVLAGGCLVNSNEDGTVSFQKIVTTYKKTESGESDDVYKYPQTLAKVQVCVFDLKVAFNNPPFVKAVLVENNSLTTNPRAVKPDQAKLTVTSLIDKWGYSAYTNYKTETLNSLKVTIPKPDGILVEVLLFLTSPLEEKAIKLEFTNEVL